jgi:hypothetical protein
MKGEQKLNDRYLRNEITSVQRRDEVIWHSRDGFGKWLMA